MTLFLGSVRCALTPLFAEFILASRATPIYLEFTWGHPAVLIITEVLPFEHELCHQICQMLSVWFFFCVWSFLFCISRLDRKSCWSKAAVCSSHGKIPPLPSTWSSSFSTWPTRTWSFGEPSRRSLRSGRIHTGTGQECVDKDECGRGERCMGARIHFHCDFHHTEALPVTMVRMWLKLTHDRLWLPVMCHGHLVSTSPH